MENTTKYLNAATDNERRSLKNEIFDEWMAYLVIKGSDQSKYGTLTTSFISQYSLGNDQYPKNIQKATDALSQHKFDQKYYVNQDKKRERQREERNNRRDQEEEDTNPTSFTQNKVICYCCGETGHIVQYCDKKDDIPRNKWYIKRAIQNMQEDDHGNSSINNDTNDDLSETSSINSNRSTTNQERGWSGFQQTGEIKNNMEHVHKQSTGLNELKDVFILDSGSTIPATIMNPDFVINIRTSKNSLGMKTNAGTKQMNLKGTVPGFGTVWFDSEQMANIFGLANMSDKYRITYDNEKEDAFNIHTENGVIKFKRTINGLYAYKPSENFLNEIANEKNMKQDF